MPGFFLTATAGKLPLLLPPEYELRIPTGKTAGKSRLRVSYHRTKPAGGPSVPAGARLSARKTSLLTPAKIRGIFIVPYPLGTQCRQILGIGCKALVAHGGVPVYPVHFTRIY